LPSKKKKKEQEQKSHFGHPNRGSKLDELGQVG